MKHRNTGILFLAFATALAGVGNCIACGPGPERFEVVEVRGYNTVYSKEHRVYFRVKHSKKHPPSTLAQGSAASTEERTKSEPQDCKKKTKFPAVATAHAKTKSAEPASPSPGVQVPHAMVSLLKPGENIAEVLPGKKEALKRLQLDAAAEIAAGDQSPHALAETSATTSLSQDESDATETVPVMTTRDPEALSASAAAHDPAANSVLLIPLPSQAIAAK